MRIPYLLGASGLALALLTVSCTTLGTHVKGGFACKAPQGTCAPMSNIDAEAIAGLGASGAGVMPIGKSDEGRDAHFILAGDEGEPVRSGEHVLRVVFPAHADGRGVYHEAAVAHVVTEHAGWMLRPAQVPVAGSLDAAIVANAPGTAPIADAHAVPAAMNEDTARGPLNLREVAAGLSAPPLATREPHEEIASDVGDSAAALPTPEALAAAREGHRIGDAVISRPEGAQHPRRGTGRRRRHGHGSQDARRSGHGPRAAALDRGVRTALSRHGIETGNEAKPVAAGELASASMPGNSQGHRP